METSQVTYMSNIYYFTIIISHDLDDDEVFFRSFKGTELSPVGNFKGSMLCEYAKVNNLPDLSLTDLRKGICCSTPDGCNKANHQLVRALDKNDESKCLNLNAAEKMESLNKTKQMLRGPTEPKELLGLSYKLSCGHRQKIQNLFTCEGRFGDVLAEFDTFPGKRLE